MKEAGGLVMNHGNKTGMDEMDASDGNQYRMDQFERNDADGAASEVRPSVGLGRLFGVSLGPGDPGLMTRAAWAALARRDAVWVYPVRSGKTPSYALAIAERAGIEPVAEHRSLVFPMTHDAEKLARAWMNGAQAVLPWLQAGQDVMFLVEGDASTYATFGHLARTVKTLDARVETPILSGVNAFTAACAAVGEPVAEQDDTVAVVPAAYGVKVLDRLLPEFDTLVLMKIKPLIDDLLDWLSARELLDRAHFIERVGAPDERKLSGQALLALRGTKVNYLSLMIIKSHHRVRGERIKGCLKKSGAQPAQSSTADASSVVAKNFL
ncbi:MAG: precorrin-2 C(20)-methyltransferase [Lautropia sp.]|nr:precorrin-2 C(20)-methyltransferase [Lautropia sp.]